MTNEQILRSILQSIQKAQTNINEDCLSDAKANLNDIATMTCTLLERAKPKPRIVT